MTTLTHGPFKRALYSPGRRDTAGPGAAHGHLAMIKRPWVSALAILLAGSAFVGVIALRTAIYLWRFGY
jgi:hypothetical protein